VGQRKKSQKECLGRGRYFVYELRRPGGSVFYVGMGSHPDRPYDHFWEAKYSTRRNHKLNTIRKIWRLGGEVCVVVVGRFLTRAEAAAEERRRIAVYRSQSVRLTNVTAGGDWSGRGAG
jgi:hypothetical protein